MTGLAESAVSLTAKEMTTAYHVVVHIMNKINKETINGRHHK